MNEFLFGLLAGLGFFIAREIIENIGNYYRAKMLASSLKKLENLYKPHNLKDFN